MMKMEYRNSSRRRNQQQSAHGKDPELNVVEAGGEIAVVAVDESEETTVSTTTEDAAAAPVDATNTNETAPAVFTNDTQAVFVNTTRRPYPIQPSTVRTATAYSLFSDPDAFSLDSIRRSTHYLSDSLKGKIWWDVNGDGKRGDYGDESLNEREYDYGIPNVNNIYLVACEEGKETTHAIGRSVIFNDQDPVPQRQSLASNAGVYEFNELNTIPSGRYYVMYQAPSHWRMSGNTLPLGRRKIVDEEKGTYYECVPEGVNGMSFSEKARESGDFDYEGYCARSIGCVHVGSRSELEDEFKAELMSLEDTKYYEEVIQGDTTPNPYGMSAGLTYTGTKWVALPTPHFMDVGMTKAEWPLSPNQFADATITLEFPASAARRLETRESPLETLVNDFSSSANFGKSKNQKAMKKAIDKFLRDNIPLLGSGGKLKESEKFVEEGEEKESEVFAYEGIDLFDGKIERKKKNRDAIGSLGTSRHLRGSRRIQEVVEVIEVTYTFTSRGAYNPPPHEQLGYFVQNSINANPDKLGRSLREDPDLPFKDLSETSSNHLTVGPPPPILSCKGCYGMQAIQNDDAGGMEEWAIIPVILLSAIVGALIFLFLSRRLWKRRREVADFDAQGDMKLTASMLDMEKEKLMNIEEEPSRDKKKNDESSHSEGSNPPTLEDIRREVKKNKRERNPGRSSKKVSSERKKKGKSMRNPSKRQIEDERHRRKKRKSTRSGREID